MKIVLATPPSQSTERWPPLGLLYIASSLRTHRSDDLRVLDAFCENLTPEQLVERVVREKPDLFGMNCSTHTFLGTMDVLERVHRALPDTTIVLGGFHATFVAEQILRSYPFIDYIIKGEAERAFPHLLDCLDRGEPPREVEGISFLEDGRHVSQPTAITQDLDALPFPARELVEHIRYGYFHKDVRLTFGKFTTICTSRGCPFLCRYCSCAAFSHRRWRPRSPENVVDEIESLEDRGYECAVFVDDNFTLNRKRVQAICGLLRERKIRMRFYCEGRVDNAPYELLRTMKKAGIDVMYFGVESATDHVLKYYNKGITPEESRTAVAQAKRAGMLVVTSFILGAPVESREDIQRTLGFIEENRPHAVQLNILDCLIGTPIWDEMIGKGVVQPEDWKRNHRIYDYNEDGFSRAELEAFVERGYAAHIQGWKHREGVHDFLRLVRTNQTGRKIVLGNLLRLPTIMDMSRQARATAEHAGRESLAAPTTTRTAEAR